MRYDPEHKQRTRRLVLKQAAAAIRQDGPDKVAVAALMTKAGLTHGGFYAHFKSKDELVGQAIATMFETQLGVLEETTHALPPDRGLVAYVEKYLSVKHRDHREQGCPVAALSSDVARMDETARKYFDAGLDGMIDRLAGLIGALPRDNARELAISVFSEMVGAMGMARSVTDPGFSEKILKVAKKNVLGRLGLG